MMGRYSPHGQWGLYNKDTPLTHPSMCWLTCYRMADELQNDQMSYEHSPIASAAPVVQRPCHPKPTQTSSTLWVHAP